MAFNPKWRASRGSVQRATPRVVTSRSDTAPPAGHPAAAPRTSSSSRTASASRQGYVPATRSTFRMAKEEEESTPRSRYATSPRQSWKNLWADIKGNPPGANQTEAQIAQAAREREEIAEKFDMPADVVLDGLDMYGVPIDYNDPDAELRDAQTLTWDNDELKPVVGFSIEEPTGDGDTQYRDIKPDDDYRGKVTVIDETTEGLPAWGTGDQAISKEDVLKNVAEPVEIDQARYDRMSDRGRSAIDFNTLLHRADQNDSRDALSDALGIEISEDDGMLSQGLIRQLSQRSGGDMEQWSKTSILTDATKELGDQAAETSSGWEFESVSEQINDLLNDRKSESILGVQGATQGSYNLQALPQTQAFETMFNDLADADEGEWTADELVGLLQQGGYDPDEFWQWAGSRLARYQQAGEGRALAPAENTLTPEEFASRLQIDLGG